MPDELMFVTPLEAAIFRIHHEIIELLLDAGAEVRQLEGKEGTAQLCFFMPETEDSTIRLLLNHPRTQNTQWQRGKLAKFACDERYDLSLIKRLMRVGLWSDETDYPTPVGKCIITDWYDFKKAYPDVRRFLLSDERRRSAVCAQNGIYPIHLAACNGDADTVRMLIEEFGVDPNLPAANAGKCVPLDYAMCSAIHWDKEHNLSTIKMLLDCGASPAEYPESLELAMERLPSALPLLLDAWLAKSGTSCQPEVLLKVAAQLGNIQLIEQLLPLCEDSIVRNAHSEYPRLEALDSAVHHGHDDAAKLLISRVLGPDAPLERFAWTIADACRNCEESTVRALLGRCPRLNNTKLVAILEEAARYQTIKIFRMILDRHRGTLSWAEQKDILMAIVDSDKPHTLCMFLQRISPPQQNAHFIDLWHLNIHYDALEAAIEKGHLSIVETFLKWDPQALYLDELQYLFLLNLAICHGYQEIALAILAAWIPSSSDENTKLLSHLNDVQMFHATQLGQAKVLAQLFSRGCRIENCSRVNRRILLSWAAGNDHADAVRVLLANGAGVSTVDSDGLTALHWTAAEGQAETARVLLEAGARVDIFDYSSKTPYLHAVRNGLSTKGTSCIVDASALPGYLYAIEQDIPQIIQLHIEMGVIGLDEMNEDHQTLLMLAVEKRAYEVAQLLLSMGCDVYKGYGNGTTPLELAQDDRMIKVLYSHM
ncbi:ankyrin repeat-containing domain protein [Aspergillus venezuelensis]